MAYTLPNTMAPDEATRKEFGGISNFYNDLVKHAALRAQNRRAEEMQPYTIKHLLSQIENSNAANQRAQGLYGLRKQALENSLDPNYEINKKINMIKMLQERFGNKPKEQEANNDETTDELMNRQLPGENQNLLLAKLKSMGMFGNQGQGQGAQLPEELQPEIGDMAMTEQQIQELEAQQPPKVAQKHKEFTDEEHALGEMIKAETGYNPYPKHVETPDEKRAADLSKSIELEKFKSEEKKAFKQEEINAKAEELHQKTVEDAKKDLPHLESTLDALKKMKKIATNNPDMFGHSGLMGFGAEGAAERYAKTSKNKNVGAWQTYGLGPIVAAEMKMSAKGNQLALKQSLANKPNFGESQEVALSKIDANIDQLEQAIKENKKISGIKSEKHGTTRVYYKGKPHQVPNNEVEAAIAAGGSLNG